MKMIAVMGSPRRNGNSTSLAERLIDGAVDNGAEVEKVYLRDRNIGPCTACDACRSATAAECVLDDDMKPLYAKIRAANAMAIASPVYWFSVSAQIKAFLDRCYALGGPEGYDLKGKRIGIVLTYADPDPFVSGAVNALRMFQDAYRYVGAEIVGMVYGSAGDPGDILRDEALLEQAYELGVRLAAEGGSERDLGTNG